MGLLRMARGAASGKRLVIRVRSDVTMSRGKYAAQAVHAALMHVGAHPGTPVIVLGGNRDEVAACETTVQDAGATEVPGGTMTAGASWAAPR